MKEKSQIVSETSILLDALSVEYNKISHKDFEKIWETFLRIHRIIVELYRNEKIHIYAGDCEFDYLLQIIENDGPEYLAIIIFNTDDNNFYEIGVCVRGKPLYKKIKLDQDANRTIKAIKGKIGSHFEN